MKITMKSLNPIFLLLVIFTHAYSHSLTNSMLSKHFANYFKMQVLKLRVGMKKVIKTTPLTCHKSSYFNAKLNGYFMRTQPVINIQKQPSQQFFFRKQPQNR